MSNVQYIELIKAKLSDAGYSNVLLDALTYQILEVAEEQNVNALTLIEKLITDNVDLRQNKEFTANIPQTTNGMSFKTYRHSNPKPNKFIERQIINR